MTSATNYNVKQRAKIIEEMLDKLVKEKIMWQTKVQSSDDKYFLLVRLILSTSVRWPAPVIAYENFRKVIKKPEDVLNVKPSII